MPNRRHRNATTTPEMREFIQTSDLPVAVLSRLLNVSETTVRKWKKRDNQDDLSHRSHTLKTTLTPMQEYVVVELRKMLQLPLDALLQVTQEFINPMASRSGLARCLKRYGVSRLTDLEKANTRAVFDKEFTESDEYHHIPIEHIPTHAELTPAVTRDGLAECLRADVAEKEVVNVVSKPVPKLSEDQKDINLFMASDPESGWVYVDLYEDDTIDAASRYMRHVLAKAPFHIRRILAGNYNEFMRQYRVIDNKDKLETEQSNAP